MSNSTGHSYNSVQDVVEKQLCCGCGTCVSVCPVGAIKMVETPAGLLVPSVDWDKCNNCGLCVRVCPGIGLDEDIVPKVEDVFEGNVIASYCGYACDEKIRQKGQSGGVVTAMLLHLLETKLIDKAIVTIMPEDGSLRPRPVLTDRREDIIAACGSKYCPVAVNEILSEVNPDDRVAMVGLPCHFHGLTKLQNVTKGLGHILKIGLICDKTLNFNAINYLMSRFQEQQNSIKAIEFRSKEWQGWPGDVCVQTYNNEKRFVSKSYRMNAKEYFTPYRCRLCFDKMNVFADIVVGDPHGICNDKLGQSVAIVRSDNARSIFEKMQASAVLRVENLDPQVVSEGQNIQKRKVNYLANINCAKKLNLPFPEPIITESANFSRENKKQLLYSYRMGMEEDKTRILNRATVRIMAERIVRKYSPGNVIRKLLELWGKK